MNKIAILVDSGTDVPQEIVERAPIFMVPLRIIFKEKEYLDRVELTSDNLFPLLKEELPKTSLPDGEAIQKVLDEIKAQGFTQVLVITISSGLSGTFNAMRMLTEHYEGLDFYLVDTKNIGIAAGMSVILAANQVTAGADFHTVIEVVENHLAKTKVFFNVDTLEYLQRGGRIGLVSSLLGSALKLKPIISCNEEGIYYTVAKVRGLNKSFEKTIQLVKEFIGEHQRFDLAVAHADAQDSAEKMKQKLREHFPNAQKIYFGTISPALSVHTGPGSLGVGVQLLD